MFYITSGKVITKYSTFTKARKAFFDLQQFDPLCTLWMKEGTNLYIYKPADGCFLPFPQD